MAEHRMGIRYGRVDAAISVAGGPRVRSGALRADLQRGPPDVRNRSAALTHGLDVEHGELDGITGESAIERDPGLAVDYETDVTTRPPHVERDDVGESGRLRDRDGADNARR